LRGIMLIASIDRLHTIQHQFPAYTSAGEKVLRICLNRVNQLVQVASMIYMPRLWLMDSNSPNMYYVVRSTKSELFRKSPRCGDISDRTVRADALNLPS
jgi:hypothetical protein